MATMKSSGDLIASISAEMADNNAGLISAEDVRTNMEDTAFSINYIVSSGDTQTQFPFHNNVTIKKDFTEGLSDSDAKGVLFVESGIKWPYAADESLRTILQTEPFQGLGNISHNDLADLTLGDTHTQYASISGVKAGLARAKFTGNQAFGSDHWINASGYYNTGFRFNPTALDGLTQDIMTSGTFAFEDNSRIANAKGTAKAWCKFSASGDMLTGTDTDNAPVIYSWHNISGISRLAPGKIKITFSSGTFANNNYVAIGQSNSSESHASKEDFGLNTVGMVERSGNDGTALRSITFAIKNSSDEYVDADLNDFVAYGYEPNETSGTVPTATKDAAYNPAG